MGKVFLGALTFWVKHDSRRAEGSHFGEPPATVIEPKLWSTATQVILRNVVERTPTVGHGSRDTMVSSKLFYQGPDQKCLSRPSIILTPNL